MAYYIKVVKKLNGPFLIEGNITTMFVNIEMQHFLIIKAIKNKNVKYHNLNNKTLQSIIEEALCRSYKSVT